MNLVSLLQLRLVNILQILHVLIIKMLVLLVHDHVPVPIAHVVLVLGVHFAQLRAYSFSRDHASHPRLHSYHDVNPSLEVFLYAHTDKQINHFGKPIADRKSTL